MDVVPCGSENGGLHIDMVVIDIKVFVDTVVGGVVVVFYSRCLRILWFISTLCSFRRNSSYCARYSNENCSGY